MRSSAPQLSARAVPQLFARALLALLCCAGVAAARRPAAKPQEATPARPDVTVILCAHAGDVVVRGSERSDVRASVSSPSAVRLRPTRAGAGAASPASSVEVLATDDGESFSCYFSGDLTVEVPRGSFVQIKTIEGKVSVTGVAGVRVETVSGDVDLQNVARSAEVASANGSLSLRKAAGRVRLHTISGSIEAADAAPAAAGDEFFAKTTSGGITLARVSHPRVEAATTSGQVEFTGALAPSGVYNLRSHSGGVTMTLPADSSFRLSARVSHGGEIDTEFAVRVAQQGAAGENILGGSNSTLRLNGLAGPGDRPTASVTLTAFSGAITLRKSAGGGR
ncbi:MAG: DUF4097 domain-containing protein [Acidobacteria bacterium]|nr:DUF4097 domain-containing protein [Acidobacteriota bacterium]